MAADGLDSRRAALRILGEVRKGRRFEVALDRAVRGLADADRRLAHEMAAGVLRRQTALDARLAPLIPRGLDGVSPALRDVLRLGALQLTALDRVPAHAAVDTSVTLATQRGGARAGGFVNAVLRRLNQRGSGAPTPEADPSSSLAAAHSHPRWLVERWVGRFGADATERLLEWNDTRPRLVLQAARQSVEELEQLWRAAGIEVEPAPYGAGLVTTRRRPGDLPGYDAGGFIVQDPAQALTVRYAGLPDGSRIYDAAAAPGGKSIGLGRSARLVLSGDISRSRTRRMAENLCRAGSNREHALVADARRPPVRPLEAVLLDAPCLGTGTFARHPDARWRVTPEALNSLATLQGELLDGVAERVAPGGLLIYATCSLEPEENELQVSRFLQRHPEFRREPSETVPPALLSDDGDLMILPQRHDIDGAYASRLRRSA
jgi:16S rRNA (cytosine967-C5)-methyltransferase